MRLAGEDLEEFDLCVCLHLFIHLTALGLSCDMSSSLTKDRTQSSLYSER